VARNDASFSPNNAFEAVFSEYNVFEDNIAEFSNYGFWLGYSRNTAVRGNRITANRSDGVSIEHGSHNTIEDNHVEGSRTGIHLWSGYPPGGADPSEDYTIRRNRILDSRGCGIWYANTARVHFENNDYVGNRMDVR
jgi:parallel beta-helix repeat protein